MPRGDRTGPMGQGPMTGRGAGYCAGHNVPGYANSAPGWGRGYGWGRGWRRGRGWGRGWRGDMGPGWGPPPGWGYPPYAPSPEQEIDALKTEAQWLKQQLDAIHQRIAELESGAQQPET